MIYMNTATTSAPALSDLVKVGDFFVWSWGYDQTNIDFFQVVSMTKCGVKLRKVANKVELARETTNLVVPDADNFVGEIEAKRPRLHAHWSGNGETTVSIRTEYGWMQLWDGEARSETAIGWGR